MKQPLYLIGAVCLCATLWTGCSGDSSEVEDSLSRSENLQFTEQLARKGDYTQMFSLGMTYYNGVEDVEKNDVLALIWLTLAAEDENLKTDQSLIEALAELGRSMKSADKANAQGQIKKIRNEFPQK